MNATEIKKLDRDERLQIMDALWDSFLEDGVELESPEWHAEILEERKRSIESGKAKFVSLDDLKALRKS